MDENYTSKPSFEQVSQDKILEELNKDILHMKTFESILHDRGYSSQLYLQALTKSKPALEVLQQIEGKSSLKKVLEAFANYNDQVLLLSFCIMYAFMLFCVGFESNEANTAFTR